MADTNGALVTSEGCASISDEQGSLQFYSDGRTVWNRLHQVMPHGTGIMGGANGSSSQEALIVPKPSFQNIYYLFTTDEWENNGINGMRFSVIDMNLDGGNGDVDTMHKNLLLFAPCAEKLAAVNHCNDTDEWVMGHEIGNNNFRAYLVTSNGIDSNAVVSGVGHDNPYTIQGGIQGPMKFSPDGKMICAVNDSFAQKVELFQFDNYTGIVSNGFLMANDFPQIHAISFSPNSTKLYIGQQGTNKLMKQFDVSVFDSVVIGNSTDIVSPIVTRGFMSLLNGSDGKLYCAEASLILTDSMLAVIDLPDLNGTSCDFNLDELNIGTCWWGFGLPNFNESYFRTSEISNCLTGVLQLQSDLVKVFPNPSEEWIYIEGTEIKSIVLLDVFGRINLNQKIDATSLRKEINISALRNGIYTLVVETKNKTLISKIIKQ
ncbi:MAG: T9SS type A sorting domain-containing protein [Bacteroidota bacterium]